MGGEARPLAPSAIEQVTAGWPDVMEEALKSSSIVEQHRALMGVILQSIQSVKSGMKEAFGGS